MTGFYDFEVFKNEWLVVFISENDEEIVVHNNPAILRKALERFDCLVGFNNYNYDDLILSGIMSGYNNYEVWKLSNSIVNGGNIENKIKVMARKLPTLDTKQELAPSLSLKETEANLGMNIIETPISFNLDRPLTDDEFYEVVKYCRHDVETTKQVFMKRQDYFESKFDICSEFGLDKLDVRKTRANLASKVLKCDKNRLPEGVLENADRLDIRFVEELRIENIPNTILNFYNNIKARFKNGENFENLEKEKLVYNLCGVEHTFAFGGLHGARENYMYEGKMLNVDVGSYYPSLMINYGFISRASEHPDLYKNLYNTRMEYKAKKDNKQQIYKILLNSTFGALKSEFNDLFDPVMSNDICVNGQLILTDLIMSLRGYTELVQSNTDGILIKYKDKDLNTIKEICKEWELNYGLNLDYEYVEKIVQRDVNNYILKTKDGKIKGKGIFANHNGGDFEKNNLTIIDMALKEYYINNKNIRETITEMIEKNNVTPFQQIAKMGATYDIMEHDGQEVQKVNRIFATWNNNYGAINKVKNNNGVKKYTKIANSSDKVYINNNTIDKTDTKLIDIDYYVRLVEKNKFIDENYKLF
jgi:possible DNA-directed DNA polymerase II|nr:MAG TPA: DNA polymerase [Caudoviricetes sp.]